MKEQLFNTTGVCLNGIIRKLARYLLSRSWAQDACNRLSFFTLHLDLDIPGIQEIFFALIRQADIFMENLVC